MKLCCPRRFTNEVGVTVNVVTSGGLVRAPWHDTRIIRANPGEKRMYVGKRENTKIQIEWILLLTSQSKLREG